MNCDRLREEIQARLDERGAAPPLPAEAQAHLGACEPCAAYAREIEAVSALLRGAPEEEPPAGFAQGVMARVRAEAPAAPAPVRRFRPLPLRVAASLAALGIGGFVAWRTFLSEDSFERTVARAPEGAAHARPLDSQEEAAPGAAKPLGGLGYLEAQRRKAGAEKAPQRSDDLDEAKGDRMAPPAAAAGPPLVAEKEKRETPAPAPTPESIAAGARLGGQEAPATDEAVVRKQAEVDRLRKVGLVKDQVAPQEETAGGGGAPVACLSYSIQLDDPEGALTFGQFAARYDVSALDVASLRHRLENEVSARDFFVSPPPADSQGSKASGAQPRILSCAIPSGQVARFDEVLQGLAGVTISRGPVFERIDPAPGAAPRSNAEEAEREASVIEGVARSLADARSARALGVDRPGMTRGGEVPVVLDGGELARSKLAPRESRTAPSAPAPSAPGPATPGPASGPATMPAGILVPVRLYLFPAPASQPAAGPKR
ncbi:MAG: hypothetical protein L0323_12435 [Planctomycetes bacterium]|nr:hypothetical protein [Planctomycetota bacterium]